MGNSTKERPILFSGAMVRAILDGRKTQTRRVVKPQPPAHMTDAVAYLRPDDEPQRWCFTGPQLDASGNALPVHQWKGGWPDCGPGFTCPYGIPGERLWVRETFLHTRAEYEYSISTSVPYLKAETLYAADVKGGVKGAGFTPSIFMPRNLSRITVEITAVRVQRVQDISKEDAKAEGPDPIYPPVMYPDEPLSEYHHVRGFQKLWDSINSKTHPWASNPWLWCLTFKRVTQ